VIKSKDSINILGMAFDWNLNRENQITNSIKNANRSLFALRAIKMYFTPNELKKF
jgi:hypothetical protein